MTHLVSKLVARKAKEDQPAPELGHQVVQLFGLRLGQVSHGRDVRYHHNLPLQVRTVLPVQRLCRKLVDGLRHTAGWTRRRRHADAIPVVVVIIVRGLPN